MDRRVIDEASIILREVASDNHDPPLVGTKAGGYTAAYYGDGHVILFRVNSWRRMTPAQRRLTVIHEWIHACGWGHSSADGFRGSSDLLSLVVYVDVYGWDGAISDLFGRLRAAADALPHRRAITSGHAGRPIKQSLAMLGSRKEDR